MAILEKLNYIVARQDSLEKSCSKPQTPSQFPTHYYEDEQSHGYIFPWLTILIRKVMTMMTRMSSIFLLGDQQDAVDAQ